MSIVMKIGPGENVAERAKRALWEVDRDGKLPQQWTFGRDVWNRLRRDATDACMPDLVKQTFFGLPYVVMGPAPADLLELDVF